MHITQAEPINVPRNRVAHRLVRHPEVCWFAAWYDQRGFAHQGKSFDTEHEAIVYGRKLHANMLALTRRHQWSRVR